MIYRRARIITNAVGVLALLGLLGVYLKTEEHSDASFARRLRATLESAGTALFEADVDGRILYASPSANRLFGYAEGELVGQSVNVLVPSEFRPSHIKALAEMVSLPSPRKIAVVTTDGVRKDKSMVHIRVRVIASNQRTCFALIDAAENIHEHTASFSKP